MASITSSEGLQFLGSQDNSMIFLPTSGMWLSPFTIEPSSILAIRRISSVVAGKTRPLIKRTFEDSLIALTISPQMFVIAVKNKLPKLCPSSPSPVLNLY